MIEATPFLPGLSPIGGKEITATFDGGQLSSDGGVLILREIEKRLGLAAMLSSSVPDTRDPGRIVHTYADMIRARLFAIASGYEDCDDLDGLRIDPAFKMACGRKPETGTDLMSQPTLPRLENAPAWRALARMALGMIDLFCASFSRVPSRIVLDIDDTDDMAHGQQQLALFNTHAGGHCFQPIHIFEANSGKPILSLIRPGKRPSGEEIARVLAHVIHRIRRRWPQVDILVRGDGHYCAPEVLDLLRKLRCDYILGLPRNKTLDALAEPWREQCRWRWKPGIGRVRRFHQFTYAAGSWSREEKVIARVEATSMGTDARFVVTNLSGRAKTLYEKVYCARGRMENLIKDMKLYTRSDKTACWRWQANQFRLFLHMGAYWLLHSLRAAAPRRSLWRTATFETLRRAFLKIAVRVEELKSRIKVAFPSAYPHAPVLALLAGTITARSP